MNNADAIIFSSTALWKSPTVATLMVELSTGVILALVVVVVAAFAVVVVVAVSVVVKAGVVVVVKP